MNRTIPFYQQAEHQYYVCALCPCCHFARTWYAIYYFCSLRTYLLQVPVVLSSSLRYVCALCPCCHIVVGCISAWSYSHG